MAKRTTKFRRDIGARLKALRQWNNLSQVDAAQMFGITQVALSRYESGTRIPEIELLTRMVYSYAGGSLDFVVRGSLLPDMPAELARYLVESLPKLLRSRPATDA